MLVARCRSARGRSSGRRQGGALRALNQCASCRTHLPRVPSTTGFLRPVVQAPSPHSLGSLPSSCLLLFCFSAFLLFCFSASLVLGYSVSGAREHPSVGKHVCFCSVLERRLQALPPPAALLGSWFPLFPVAIPTLRMGAVSYQLTLVRELTHD